MVGGTARRAFVATTVAGMVVVGALALWHLKILLALLLLAFIIAAAMRPGVEWLHNRSVPRGFGVAIHYIGLLVVIGLLLWLIVPRVVGQVQHAIKESQSATATKNSKGIKHEVLIGLRNWLKKLPSGGKLVHLSITFTKKLAEVFVGIFFMLAVGAYWIFEKVKAQRLVLGLIPRAHRRVVRDTWDLIDAKLGAFVRGQLLMILFVSSLLSLAFWLDGLPYWLLVGISAGIVELVPVIGPLAAAVAAIGIGLTAGVPTAIGAAIAVFGLRLLQDYLVGPRVLGHAVGLSPLIVLVTVTTVGLLLGGFYVLLAVPLAALLATVFDVIVLEKDPAEEEVPNVLFPAKDTEPA